jgi:hypothetical protein
MMDLGIPGNMKARLMATMMAAGILANMRVTVLVMMMESGILRRIVRGKGLQGGLWKVKEKKYLF